MWLVWCLAAGVAFLLYFYLEKAYSYWWVRNVPTAPYHYGVGSLWETLIMRKNVGMVITELYNKYPEYNYLGYYTYMRPSLLIRDPALIKDILIKDFNSFRDNDIDTGNENDILAQNPFVKKGDEWKTVRAQLTPSFTSGKIKEMFPLIIANADKLWQYVEKHRSGAIDAKELATRFTGDNVASCAFGLDGKCLEKDDADFYQIGKSILEPTVWNAVRIMFIVFLPKIAKLFNLSFFDKRADAFLQSVVDQTLEYRKTNNVHRGDFLDAMLDLKAKINDEHAFNNRTVLSHCASFFADGMETSAVVISFTLYEIAANSDVQDKLRAEIDRVLAKHNNEITYEALQEMEYLDCVIKESLRRHPPAFSLHKVCTQRYKLPSALASNEGMEIYIEPGTSIAIPLQGVHSDPQYYPEPQRFRPERFIDANMPKGTYLPFGDGPRMCLGNKFGLLQTKISVAALVHRYKLSVDCGKTRQPIVYDPKSFIAGALGGLWLHYETVKS